MNWATGLPNLECTSVPANVPHRPATAPLSRAFLKLMNAANILSSSLLLLLHPFGVVALLAGEAATGTRVSRLQHPATRRAS